VRGAEERATHPEGDEFNAWFNLLMIATPRCFDRDVLRDCKEYLWEAWKRNAGRPGTTTCQHGTPTDRACLLCMGDKE